MEITRKQYLEAKKMVEEYQIRQYQRALKELKPVRLSKYGREMQTPHNKTGVVIHRRLAGMTDYTVEVLWEDGKREEMDESQTEIIK